jgi:hypothetical protein
MPKALRNLTLRNVNSEFEGIRRQPLSLSVFKKEMVHGNIAFSPVTFPFYIVLF